MTDLYRRVSEIGAMVIVVALVPGYLAAQPATTAATRPGDWTYTVRPGDSLWAIGRSHLVHPSQWPTLQRINRLGSDRLRPGMRLRIPFDMMRLRPTPATVLAASGPATVIRTDGQRAPLSAGMPLYVGDAIETGDPGSASIGFADDSTMLIGSNARVVFDLLAGVGPTGMVDTRVRLERGRVRPAVTPRRGRFQIWSPSLQVTTRGTAFRVEAADGGAVGRVEVTESGVDAAAGAATVIVAQGTGTLARGGGPPAVPVPLLAAPALGTLAPLRRLPLRVTIPAAPGASGYHWEVSPDAAFRSLVVDTRSTAPAVQLPDLPDGTYEVRVRAVDAQGLEGLDAGAPLRVDARPEPPFLMSPAPAAVVRQERPPLTWTQPAGAAGFRVQVAQDDAFARVLLDTSAEPGRAFVPEPSLEPGTYRWRVATRLPDGKEGPFGDGQTFVVRRAPAAPSAEPPGLEGDRVTLRWPAGEPGSRYYAQLARDPLFASIHSEHTVSEPMLALPRPAPGTYHLRVRTIEADGYEGAFGAPQSFEVLPPEAPARPGRRWWPWVIPPAAIAALVALLL
jgi:hypothetical protein